jgi:hypothetical protein
MEKGTTGYPGDLTYVRFILVGMWECLRFGIDRRMRLHISR